MFKLGQVGHPKIDRSGCYFLDFLDMAEDRSGKTLEREMVTFAYDLAVPQFMRKDCYLLNHEKVLAVAFMAVGLPNIYIKYEYREDEGKIIIPGDLDKCDYFVAGVAYENDPDGRHFYRGDWHGNVIWNPGQTVGEVVTLRGYIIG